MRSVGDSKVDLVEDRNLNAGRLFRLEERGERRKRWREAKREDGFICTARRSPGRGQANTVQDDQQLEGKSRLVWVVFFFLYFCSER